MKYYQLASKKDGSGKPMNGNECPNCQFCTKGKSQKIEIGKEVRLQFKQMLKDFRFHKIAMTVDGDMLAYYKENSVLCAICLEPLTDDRLGSFSYIKCPSNRKHSFHLDCLVSPNLFFKECPICRWNSRSESVELFVRFSILYACQCLGERDSKTIQKIFARGKGSWGAERVMAVFKGYDFLYYELLILNRYYSRIKYKCFRTIKAEIIKGLICHRVSCVAYSQIYRELEITNPADIHTYPAVYEITGGFVGFLSSKHALLVLEIIIRTNPLRSDSTRSQIRDFLGLILQHTEHFFDHSFAANVMSVISASGDIETLDFIYRHCKIAYKFDIVVIEEILLLATRHTTDINEYELTMLYILLTKGSLFSAEEEHKMISRVIDSNSGGTIPRLSHWLNSMFILRHGPFFNKLKLFSELISVIKTGQPACPIFLSRLECSLSNLTPAQVEKIIFLFPDRKIWLFSDIHQIFAYDLLPIKFYLNCMRASASSKNVPACCSLLRIITAKEYFSAEILTALIGLFIQYNATFLIYILFTMTRSRVMIQLRDTGQSEHIISKLEAIKLYFCIPFLEGFVQNQAVYNEVVEKRKEQIISLDLKIFLKCLPDEYCYLYQHLPFYYRYFSEYILKSPSFRGLTREDLRRIIMEYMKSSKFYDFVGEPWLTSLCDVLYTLGNGPFFLEILLALAPSTEIKQLIKIAILRMIFKPPVGENMSVILKSLGISLSEVENFGDSSAVFAVADRVEPELLLAILQKTRNGIIRL